MQSSVQDFILKNENADPHQLALKAHLYPELPISLIINQIGARQKAKTKLPSFYLQKDIIYPVALSLEQCSSEQTASYKANLLKGNLLIDLTGGFGVDAYFLSKNFEKVIYVEKNAELAAIAKHNFQVLKADNVEVINADAIDFLTKFEGMADYIYLDPARRDTANRKMVRLEDCEPNILEIMPLLKEKAYKIVLKTSPMLDIDLAIKELKTVRTLPTLTTLPTVERSENFVNSLVQNFANSSIKIIVLSVENECKEVIYWIEKGRGEANPVQTINFSKNKIQQFDFEILTEQNAVIDYSLPQAYLYEPNASVLKAGAFKSVALHYKLAKLHVNSHLYTSNGLVADFAGRIFKIHTISKLDKKELQKYLPENKANIAVRNFPLSVAEIRKKTGINEGGETYLFATIDAENKKVVLICTRI